MVQSIKTSRRKLQNICRAFRVKPTYFFGRLYIPILSGVKEQIIRKMFLRIKCGLRVLHSVVTSTQMNFLPKTFLFIPSQDYTIMYHTSC